MLQLSAKPVVESLERSIQQRIDQLKKKTGRAPGLAVVLVGEDPASVIYTTKKTATADRLGMFHCSIKFPASVSPAEVRKKVDELNADPKIDGILIQRPLPPQFDPVDTLLWVEPDKDVDSFHPLNSGRITQGMRGLRPCTLLGVMKILEHYKIPLAGKTACVIGRSAIVGKPMAALLLEADATVIHCHSRTRDMARLTRQAEILVVAAGKPLLVDASHVAPGAVVVDVGIHRLPTGKLCGDVDYESVAKVASALTPVPGGVGPMTITMLMHNTVQAAETRS
jgi:methylenetetrahydrofolate dehydrogenase (NADP+)/methenyltetrahydrofolate cyclohydrolase